MDSIFSRIIKADSPAYKIAEDADHLAFLDVSPLKKGHTLVIPKKQVDKLFDLSEGAFVQLMRFVHRTAKSIEQVVPCQRVGLMVMGFEVPHAHVHLVPMDQESDLNFSNLRMTLSKEAFSALAGQIGKVFKKASNVGF
ncbi:MAG: HIT family protein [Flavobacteriales bacterium AspAUS03]